MFMDEGRMLQFGAVIWLWLGAAAVGLLIWQGYAARRARVAALVAEHDRAEDEHSAAVRRAGNRLAIEIGQRLPALDAEAAKLDQALAETRGQTAALIAAQEACQRRTVQSALVEVVIAGDRYRDPRGGVLNIGEHCGVPLAEARALVKAGRATFVEPWRRALVD